MMLLPSAPVLHIFEAPYLSANLTFLKKQYSPYWGGRCWGGQVVGNIVFDLGG